MTINQQFRALVVVKQVVMWTAVFAVCAYAFRHHGQIREQEIMTVAVLICAGVIVYLAQQSLSHCPRCKADLRNQEPATIRGAKVAKCPNCGLRVDEAFGP